MIAIMSIPVFDRLLPMANAEQRLGTGGVLFRADDPVLSLFLVTAGELRLVRTLPHGFQLTLQRADPGAILAEASIFADRYHCDAVTAEDSAVRAVPISKVRAAIDTDPALTSALLRHLAGEVRRMRSRAEILSLKTVSAKVDGWMALNGGALPGKGRWHRVASEIGVTSQALYRELARRR
jgi:CRP-like cAMP-binding protein